VLRDAGAQAAGGIEVELFLEDGPGDVRVPVPTGHAVDPESVRLGRRGAELFLSTIGEPLLRTRQRYRGVLRYRTRPAPAIAAPGRSSRSARSAELRDAARRLEPLPIEERVTAASGWVRRRIRPSSAASVAQLHRAARQRHEPFLRRALAIGAGDCDVQNGVLAELLREAGVPARLVVGYLGNDGKVVPWLHAWVEYRAADGFWRIADASDPMPPAAARPAVATGEGEEPEPARPEPPRPQRAWLLLLGALLLGTAVWLLVRRGARRSVRLAPDHDVSRLLLGALRHPDAFHDVPAVFRRRLVPLVGGGRASLLSVWQHAAEGRLFRSRRRGALATVASRHGPVVDVTRREGAAVADTLGAADLDRWQAILDASHSDPLLERVARRLSRPGERLRLRVASSLSETMVLELPPRGRLSAAERYVVIPDAPPWWLHGDAGAQLDIADRLLDELDVPLQRRAELLAGLCRSMLLEVSPR
jgi:hypothetical protein